MERLVRMVVLGQSGAGKSRFISLLTNNGINILHEPTLVCCTRYCDISFDGDRYKLRMVDTPGFFQEGVTDTTKNWRDVAEAVHKSDMMVNVFVIVLKATELKKSEEVVQSFVELLGDEAPVKAVVVFTDVKEQITERVVSYEHGNYLDRYLRKDYPTIFWKDDDPRRSANEFMGVVKATIKQKPYEGFDFSVAQMEFTKRWIENQKKKVPMKKFYPLRNDKLLLRIGVPDVVVTKFFSQNQIDDLSALIRR